jgi:hypothetical protein
VHGFLHSTTACYSQTLVLAIHVIHARANAVSSLHFITYVLYNAVILVSLPFRCAHNDLQAKAAPLFTS